MPPSAAASEKKDTHCNAAFRCEKKDTHCNAAFRCGGAGRRDHDGDF
jgi:hypothetical protein